MAYLKPGDRVRVLDPAWKGQTARVVSAKAGHRGAGDYCTIQFEGGLEPAGVFPTHLVERIEEGESDG